MTATGPARRSDHSLADRIRDGSEGAATELHARYAHRLVALAQKQCGGDLAVRVDAEDLVQSAFASFFRGARDGLYTVPTGEEIWGLLLVMTLNKVRACGEYHRAAKRDVRKTTSPNDGFDPPATDEQAASILQLTIEEVLFSLPEENRPLVKLRIDGCDVAEIAERTGRAKRSVERVLQQFRTAMAEAWEAEPT